MNMFVESIRAGIYLDETTEQAYEYFDYLANLTSDWAYTRTNNMIKSFAVIPTQNVGTKYQLTTEDNLNAKLTALSKQVEALAFAKATTSLPKETSTICALCDIMDHCIGMCPIVAG